MADNKKIFNQGDNKKDDNIKNTNKVKELPKEETKEEVIEAIEVKEDIKEEPKAEVKEVPKVEVKPKVEAKTEERMVSVPTGEYDYYGNPNFKFIPESKVKEHLKKLNK